MDLWHAWVGLSFANLLVRSAVGLGTHSRHGIGLDGLGQSLGPVATSAEITDWPFSTPEHAIENAKRPQAGSRLFRLFSPRKVQPAQRGLRVIRPLPDSKAGWSSTHCGSHRKILSGPRPFGATKIELI